MFVSCEAQIDVCLRLRDFYTQRKYQLYSPLRSFFHNNLPIIVITEINEGVFTLRHLYNFRETTKNVGL